MPGNESTAKLLGYAGLIPFLTFSVGCWLPLPFVSDSLSVLIAYAAVILAFMGAVHWGAAMSRDNNQGYQYLLVSVVPALAAWIALMLPALAGLVILLSSFILLYLYDRAVQHSQGFPSWYIPMRTNLTLVVTLCLASALLSIA